MNDNHPTPTKAQLFRGFLIYMIMKSFVFFGTAFSTLMILFKIFNMTSLSWWVILSPLLGFASFLFLSFASIGMYAILREVKSLKEYEIQSKLLNIYEAAKTTTSNKEEQSNEQ